MFNTLYRCSRTIARHENGPLDESRRRYLEHLSAQGAALHTIRAAAGVIYRATVMMELDESSPVEQKDVERAAKRWAHRWYRNASSRGPDLTDKEFRQTTCNWLRFAGRLRESDRVPRPTVSLDRALFTIVNSPSSEVSPKGTLASGEGVSRTTGAGFVAHLARVAGEFPRKQWERTGRGHVGGCVRFLCHGYGEGTLGRGHNGHREKAKAARIKWLSG
jgi:hypothetical protein